MFIISWLMDTSMGMPGLHGIWPIWLTLMFHMSNLTISCALFYVPMYVIQHWKYHRDGITAWQIFRAVAFFPAISLSHFARTIEVFGPPYHLTTLLDVNSAIWSIYSLTFYPTFINHIIKLPGREEIHRLNNDLHLKTLLLEENQQALLSEKKELVINVDNLRDILKNEAWTQEKIAEVDHIRKTLQSRAGVGVNIGGNRIT